MYSIHCRGYGDMSTTAVASAPVSRRMPASPGGQVLGDGRYLNRPCWSYCGRTALPSLILMSEQTERGGSGRQPRLVLLPSLPRCWQAAATAPPLRAGLVMMWAIAASRGTGDRPK